MYIRFSVAGLLLACSDWFTAPLPYKALLPPVDGDVWGETDVHGEPTYVPSDSVVRGCRRLLYGRAMAHPRRRPRRCQHTAAISLIHRTR